MKALFENLLRLRWSIVFLLVALLVAAMLAVGINNLLRDARRGQQALAMQVNDIRSRVDRAHDEEQEMRGRIERYQAMADKDIIGQEERLDWVEQISRIKTARRLLNVEYEIQPQGPISPAALPGGAAAGPYDIMASTMTLRMQLLHEDDLLGFIADLRQAVHAHLMIRSCRIERAATGDGPGLRAQLLADCTIDWITLRERKP